MRQDVRVVMCAKTVLCHVNPYGSCDVSCIGSGNVRYLGCLGDWDMGFSKCHRVVMESAMAYMLDYVQATA